MVAIASLTNGCIYLKVKENKTNCARYETQSAKIEDKFKRWWRASDEYKEEWNSDKRYQYMKEGGFSNLSASAWKQDEQRAYEENRETYRSTSPEWKEMQKKYKRLFLTDNPTEFCNYLKEKETLKRQ